MLTFEQGLQTGDIRDHECASRRQQHSTASCICKMLMITVIADQLVEEVAVFCVNIPSCKCQLWSDCFLHVTESNEVKLSMDRSQWQGLFKVFRACEPSAAIIPSFLTAECQVHLVCPQQLLMDLQVTLLSLTLSCCSLRIFSDKATLSFGTGGL